MEEVWKDINLASLNDHNTHPLTTDSTFHGSNRRDSLSRPFTKDLSSPTSMVSSASDTASAPLFCPPTRTPPPATALSLRSHPEFHFNPLRPKDLEFVQPLHTASKVSPFSNPFGNRAFSSSLPPFGSKRLAESDSNSTGERRNKRMIKNRESAARSRARKQEKYCSFEFFSSPSNILATKLNIKVSVSFSFSNMSLFCFLQAYTNELQLKVNQLLEENARLKRQQQQFCETAACQPKKKNHLFRTTTAPF